MEDIKSIHALAYFNLLKTGSWIEEEVKKALKPLNLTHAQLNALYILNENHPEPVSVNELKEKILVSNPDVTRLVDRLVKKGYVLRETCTENRRKIDITLTDPGMKCFMEAHQSAKKSIGDYFEKQITEDEASELRRILHKIWK
jgi:DNA-binding MarR family transcriptional regulator